MIRNLFGLLLLAWVLGFGLFMLSLGKPRPPGKTDAIVVLTGGPGRIDRGLVLMRSHSAKRMLVSGVAPEVRPHELAAAYKAERALFACCIDLGHEAVDTRSNAEETAAWVKQHGYKSVRLVTSDWHMPRATLELSHALEGDVTIEGDGVKTSPRFATLFNEYHKYLVRSIALLVGAG